MKWYTWAVIILIALYFYRKYKMNMIAVNPQGYQSGCVGTSGCLAPSSTIAAGNCQPVAQCMLTGKKLNAQGYQIPPMGMVN